MTEITVKPMDADQADKTPPPGTAIVRPLRHVRAVRERYMLRFTDPAQAAASRSARAWAWALGETTIAPVTDETTGTPPSRAQIQVEIAIADDRRLRGDRENRADAAATILRWLIGDEDHVPVRGDDVGELVGGFGDIVRSRAEIAGRLADAVAARQKAAVPAQPRSPDLTAAPHGQQDADYLDGVAATLAWILGERTESPITCGRDHELTTRVIKTERIHAADVAEQARIPSTADHVPSRSYGQGVNAAITWLLGEATALV